MKCGEVRHSLPQQYCWRVEHARGLLFLPLSLGRLMISHVALFIITYWTMAQSTTKKVCLAYPSRSVVAKSFQQLSQAGLVNPSLSGNSLPPRIPIVFRLFLSLSRGRHLRVSMVRKESYVLPSPSLWLFL